MHFYVDDAQLVFSGHWEDKDILASSLIRYIEVINLWMASNRLKINQDKTELLWCATVGRVKYVDNATLSLSVTWIYNNNNNNNNYNNNNNNNAWTIYQAENRVLVTPQDRLHSVQWEVLMVRRLFKFYRHNADQPSVKHLFWLSVSHFTAWNTEKSTITYYYYWLILLLLLLTNSQPPTSLPV